MEKLFVKATTTYSTNKINYFFRDFESVHTHVFVVDEFHELELPVGPLRVGHVLERPRELFDGHVLLGDAITGRAGK